MSSLPQLRTKLQKEDTSYRNNHFNLFAIYRFLPSVQRCFCWCGMLSKQTRAQNRTDSVRFTFKNDMTPITSIATIRTSKHFSGPTVEGVAPVSSLSSNHAHFPLIHEITCLQQVPTLKYILSDSSSNTFQLLARPAIFSHDEFHSVKKIRTLNQNSVGIHRSTKCSVLSVIIKKIRSHLSSVFKNFLKSKCLRLRHVDITLTTSRKGAEIPKGKYQGSTFIDRWNCLHRGMKRESMTVTMVTF